MPIAQVVVVLSAFQVINQSRLVLPFPCKAHEVYMHMFIKNSGRFCKQNSKKGEKKRKRILERRYSIDFEKSACENGAYIWKQIITKLKQTGVYKWQCEYEYPSKLRLFYNSPQRSHLFGL